MMSSFTFRRILKAAGLASLICIVVPAERLHADELPENTSLIKLKSRVFDMRSDVSRIRRNDRFIPINRVPWIQDFLWDDADLSPTVVHVQTAPSGADYVWHPSKPDLMEAGRSVPEVMKIPGYDVHLYSTHYILVPISAGDYYAICGTTEDHLMISSCNVISAYPPDNDIRLRIRVYRRPDQPMNDLAAIARKAAYFVRCVLDVTEEVERGTWAQLPHIGSGDFPNNTRDCSTPIS